MKVDIVKVVKVGSVVASVLSVIGTAWAGTKENQATLEALVEKHLNK